MNDEIMVSICCITYNQEKYIRETLDGFLMQKTNFKYEIIIRDDASTDNTALIIKEYEKKYPDIIKPIYESVNGLKRGVKRAFYITFEKARGKYIALCEGDDYWINDKKLQKQIDYMEENPKCTFCFHDADILYMSNMKKERFFNSKRMYKKFLTNDGNYNASNIHLIGLGGMPTASFVFKKEHVEKLPKWYFDACCGDMPLKLITTSYGYAHFINEKLSVYRRETGISIVDQWKCEQQKNIEKTLNRIKNVIKIIDDFDEYTNFEFKHGLDISREMYNVELKIIESKYKEVLKNKNLFKYYKIRYNDRLGIKLIIRAFFPQIYKKLKLMKKN